MVQPDLGGGLRATLKRMSREPLLYFLITGGALFVWFGLISAEIPEATSSRIVIDERSFDRYLMHRNPRLDLVNARRMASEMSDSQRDSLVEQMVREEVLYREALAIGLDTNDYASKRRLITQLDYINQASFHDGIVVSNADITRYFQIHQDRYREPPRITFTHVFFSSDRHADPKKIAMERKESLNREQIPFHLGTSYGDHFLYHRNYVGKTYDEVASHFGSGFAGAVLELSKRQQWEGPVASEYGQHLVMIGDRIAARVPPLEEVAGRIREDLILERVEQKRQQFFERALARYDVEIELDGLLDAEFIP